MIVKRGDIVNVQFPKGEIVEGTRPSIIVSNDIANRFSPFIQVIPIVSIIQKAKLPVHLELPQEKYKQLFKDSVAVTEKTTAIRKEWLQPMILGTLDNEDIEKLNKMIQIQFGLVEI